MQLLCLLTAALPLTNAAVPGMFFWKPRVGLDISVPTLSRTVNKPTWENVHQGYVVVLDGYQAGLTVAALSSYMQDVSESYPHLHPGSAHYYTNMYRWAARHLSLFSGWFEGKTGNYVTTHKVWQKRYSYMNYFVPQWMRKILFFVNDESWKYEEWEWKKFEKYAGSHFGKFNIYPSKTFNDWNSMRRSTGENNVSDSSIVH